MQDAVTNLIKTYDISGSYLDRNAIDSLQDYFKSGAARVAVATAISGNAASVVKLVLLCLSKFQNCLALAAMPILLVVFRLACAIWTITYAMLAMLWLLEIWVFSMREFYRV